MTVSASANAPPSQNVLVTLTGTPEAPVPQAATTFFVSVTQTGRGAVLNNRTDYVSTEGTPFGAAYDAAHNVIFASNPAWNRVDVISNISHTIVKEISIPAPRGIDISPDGSRAWVMTASQQVFEINTATLAAILHHVGPLPPVGFYGETAWIGYQIYALADGTVMLTLARDNCCGPVYFGIFDPAAGTFEQMQLPPGASNL